MLKLYNYFRSSTSYRVRIVLHLKGLPFEYIPVHLLRNGGEQHSVSFHQRNPQELVPTLQDGDVLLSQSLAIMEYLEECYPIPALLPEDAGLRAHIRQLMLMMACEMHPLCNLRVLQYLSTEVVQEAQADEVSSAWIQHWTKMGLQALEEILSRSTWRGAFCVGDQVTLADCCLIPQLAHARRFKVDLTSFPTLLEIEKACHQLAGFRLAAPESQIDAEF